MHSRQTFAASDLHEKRSAGFTLIESVVVVVLLGILAIYATPKFDAGTMTLDDSKLDSALQDNFEDSVKMLSNSRATPTLIRALDSGSAGDAVKKIDDMLGITSTLATQTSNASKQQVRFEDDLKKLDDRMSKLLDRYNEQFSAMESLVNMINSQKSSLKSTFDAMLNQSK